MQSKKTKSTSGRGGGIRWAEGPDQESAKNLQESGMAVRSKAPQEWEVSCRVVHMDGVEVDVCCDKTAKGQILFDKVMSELNVFEKDYFGLTYMDAEKKRNWLDNDKQVCKQCGKENLLFFLEVRFFPPDPSVLKQEITPYLICLQIRNDIVNAKLPCSFPTKCLLGSYLAQSIFGDYDVFSMGPDYEYLAKFPMSPTVDWDMTEKVHELHQLHRGQTPTEAEKHYLENAAKLSMYGVELHPALDSEGVDASLGVSWSGLILFRGKLRIHRYPWSSILDVSAKRNFFQLKTKPGEFEQTENIINFKLDTPEDVNRLWKRCIDNHAFYRLMTPAIPNKEIASIIPGLGSSQYQYSGRTLYQACLASCMLERKAPAFWRNPVQRVPMLRNSGKCSWMPTHDATCDSNMVPKRSVGFRDHHEASIHGSSGSESEGDSFSNQQAHLHNTTNTQQDISHIPKPTTSKTLDRVNAAVDNNVQHAMNNHCHNVEDGASITKPHLPCNIDAANPSNIHTQSLTERNHKTENMESEHCNDDNKFADNNMDRIFRDVNNDGNTFPEIITKSNRDKENAQYSNVSDNEYGAQPYNENSYDIDNFQYKERNAPDSEIYNIIGNKIHNKDNSPLQINNERVVDSKSVPTEQIDKGGPKSFIENILDNIETGLYKDDNFARKVIDNVPNISFNDGCAKAATKQEKLCEVKGYPTYNYKTYYNNKDDALEKESNQVGSKPSTYCCCLRSHTSASLLGLHSEHPIDDHPVTSTNSTYKFDFLRHESTTFIIQILPMLTVVSQSITIANDQGNSNLICRTSTPESFSSLNQPLLLNEQLSEEVMVANKSIEMGSGLQDNVSNSFNMQPSTSNIDRNSNLICRTSTPEPFISLLSEEMIVANKSPDIEPDLENSVSGGLNMRHSTSHFDQTTEYIFDSITKESDPNAQFMLPDHYHATFVPSSFHEINLEAFLVRCQPIYESVDATVEMCIQKPGDHPHTNPNWESISSTSEASIVPASKRTTSQPKIGIFKMCFSCTENSEQSSPAISNVRERINKKKADRTDWILGYPKYDSVPTKRKIEVFKEQLEMKEPTTCDVQISIRKKDVIETPIIGSKPNIANFPSETNLERCNRETNVKPIATLCVSNLEPLSKSGITEISTNIPVSSVELAQSTYDNVENGNSMSTSAKKNINISVIPQNHSQSNLFSQMSDSNSESNTSTSSNEADTKRRKIQFYTTDKTTPSIQYKMTVSPISDTATDSSVVADTIRSSALDNSYSSSRSDGMSNSTASTASTICERRVENETSKNKGNVSTKLPMHLCDVIEWPNPPEDEVSLSDPIDDKQSMISIGSQSELRRAFELYDTDGRGRITTNDIERVITDVGLEPNEEWVRNLVNEADLNRDGIIDWLEFSQTVGNNMSSPQPS